VNLTVAGRSVTWVDTNADLALALGAHPTPDLYSLDTEFSSGYTYDALLALVQLAIGTEVFLIDPLKVDLRALAPLFNSSALALLHAAEQDLELLGAAVGNRPAHLFDTQVAAQLIGLSVPSLAALAKGLGVTLDKSRRLTDWTIRPLSTPALHYAASDVVHLPELYAQLREKLEKLGRRPWLDEESQVALNRPAPPRVPQEAWWRIAAAHSAKPSQHLPYQRLASAREHIAIARNVPPSHVLPDSDIVAIVRALTKDDVGPAFEHIDADLRRPLLESLSQPFAEGELHHITTVLPTPSQERAIAVLAAFATEAADAAHIDRQILATKTDITAYVVGFPSRLDTGWRRHVLTDTLDDLLAGRSSLALGGARLTLRQWQSGTTAP
jgi:ribonuclease D